jgi:hypothetical protein
MRSFSRVATLLGAAVTPAAAQLPDLPLSVEVRAGALVPLGDWGVRDRETALRVGSGPLVSGVLRLELPERLSAYGTYRHARLSCDECELFGLDGSVEDTGFGFGIGYLLPLELPLSLRLDLGGITHQLAFRGFGETRPSDWGLGGEAGLIGSFELLPSLFLEPAIAGAVYRARFEFEEEEVRDVNVRYLTPRIGLRYRF